MKSINANLYRSEYYCQSPYTEPLHTIKKAILHKEPNTSLYKVMVEAIGRMV